ncbi:MAG: GAF domain-containing protein [Anaerolineales bacterium]|nr:GAF domain-containing protein [Anaerolineales bacterium]
MKAKQAKNRIKTVPVIVLTMTVLVLAAACSPVSPWNSPKSLSQVPLSPTAITPRNPESLLIRPTSPIHFTHLGLDEGLSQSVVYAILQDSNGFMWFGTEDGLNRYNGYEFQVFKPDQDDPNSPSDRWITTLYEDQRGNIWIGTRLGGLNKYDPQSGQFSHYRHETGNPHSLSHNNVQAIYGEPSGILWIGTSNGLDFFDPSIEKFLHYKHDPDNPASLSSNNVTAISGDDRGFLWIGTQDGGLNRFGLTTGIITRYLSEPGKLCSNNISSIRKDSHGEMWIGTSGGLSRFTPDKNHFTCYNEISGKLTNNEVFTVYIDRIGDVWIGTNHGLNYFNPEKNTFTHFVHDPATSDSLSNNTVFSINEDNSGVLWVGTYGGGLNKYNRGQEKFTKYRNDPDNPNSLSNNLVFPIHADHEGIIWIGTYGGGLNRFDPNTGFFSTFLHQTDETESISGNYIWSIYRDHRGYLWIGTSEGLDRLHLQSGELTHYVHSEDPFSIGQGNVNALFEDSNGDFWVGTDQGLDQLEFDTGRFYHYRYDPQDPLSYINEGKVVSIYEDRARNLWVGTFANGLNRYSLTSGSSTNYSFDSEKPGSLSNNSVMCVYQDRQNRLWVATAGGGLNLFEEETHTFHNFTEKDGLPSNVVYGIQEDRYGFLWLSTNAGLSRLDPKTFSFRNYTASDGLQSNQFNQYSHAQSRDGAMYFGGINGLNVFDPEQILDNQSVPPVVLTSITQDGQTLKLDTTPEMASEITLQWPNNSFEFEFAALGYADPNKNQYAYMLENFDKDWYYIGTIRNGRYTNLPGGAYLLHLKASNNDGIWNETGKSVKVTVVPPFWQTWWFRGGLILLAGLAVFSGYRLRIRNIELRNLELQRLVSERTNALERRNEEMAALYQADEKMLRTLTLDQVFETLVNVAVDMLHADKSAVFIWNKSQRHFVIHLSRGFNQETIKVFHFDRNEGLVGRVAENGELAIVQDIHQEPVCGNDRPEVLEAIITENIQSFMVLPVLHAQKTIGVLTVFFKESHAVTEDILRLFQTLLQRAALSIENTHLFEQTKELAILEERNRLARDLHDSAKQKAFAALAQLGTANGVLKTNSTNAQKHVSEAENLVYEVIQELTFLIQEMYPLALKEKGLATTLREYIFEWENRSDIDVKLVIERERRLQLQIEQAIYRTIQESLANVARHSKATKVNMKLIYNEENLIVRVIDNGRGFNIDQRPAGMGLRSMRERIESVNGSVRVESAPGEGTIITIQVPLKESISIP